MDQAGNLYGTTYEGGSCAAYYGCGTVFKIEPGGKETVIYSFGQTGEDGALPYAGLVRDSKGNLYGTTVGGGDYHCEPYGCGIVFKLDTAGKETILHAFTTDGDGYNPYGSLIRDKSGNFYGTTAFGGTSFGGIVFKLDVSSKETILYSFTGREDGGVPFDGVIRDTAGNLYGTTYQGGAVAGTVFKVDTAGKETVLYNFTSGNDGASPYGSLVRDSAGNLYGTTASGGSSFNGTVFKLAP